MAGLHNSFQCDMDRRKWVGLVFGKIEASRMKGLTDLQGRHPLVAARQDIAATFSQCLGGHLWAGEYGFRDGVEDIGNACGSFGQSGRRIFSCCVKRKTFEALLEARDLAVHLRALDSERFLLLAHKVALLKKAVILYHQRFDDALEFVKINHTARLADV